MVVKIVLGSHFGVGEFTTHFRTYFSGDWDVDWGTIWILTHGHVLFGLTNAIPTSLSRPQFPATAMGSLS